MSAMPSGFPPSVHRARRRPTLALLGLALAVTFALAACGGSSSTTTATSASSTTGASGATGTSTARRAAVTACLKKAGLSLPARPGGAGGPGGGARPGGGAGFLLGGGGGGPTGAAGAQFAKLTAALKACGITGGLGGGGRGLGGAGGLRNSAAYKARITSYVTCVRKNGFNLPSPNLSGTGPVFSSSQVNTKDPKFVAASAKCASLLQFRRPGGAGASGAAGAAATSTTSA
jgi:hypothetical protein